MCRGVQRHTIGSGESLVLIYSHNSPRGMTDADVQRISDTYRDAASTVGLPDGWFLEVVPSHGGYTSEGSEVVFAVEAILVSPDREWYTVAEHDRPVPFETAHRRIRRALSRCGVR